MADYKKMYYELFNAISKAIEILREAQQLTEDIYISADAEPQIVLLSDYSDKDKPET